MRGMRNGLFVTAAALAWLAGCAQDQHLKPPMPDPQYVLPPSDDPRFSTYPKFPEKTLNAFPKKPQTPDEFSTPGAMPGRQRFGAGGAGGMGGP